MSADLSGCIFRECVIIGSLLEKCDLSHTCFYHADTRETRFNKSNLEGADMRGINLFNGSLRKARLTNTDLRGANLYGAELYKAVFGNTQLEKANVKMTLLSKRTEFLS